MDYHEHKLTLFKVIFLSVCGMYFAIYTISINILCISQEGLILAESYRQIYDFYK